MQTFTFPAKIEPGAKRGLVVTFPDVPEAITQGRDMADARAQAAEALSLALLTYPERSLPLPRPRAHKGCIPISAAPEVAAKLAVLEAFRLSGTTKSELARKLGKDEKEIRRILDPRHATRLAPLSEALAMLGHRLVIGIEKAA